MHQPAPVRLERRGDIALIIIDNPPVNASSQAVRQGLFAAVRETIADDQVKAAVIACAGATFVAGADIHWTTTSNCSNARRSRSGLSESADCSRDRGCPSQTSRLAYDRAREREREDGHHD